MPGKDGLRKRILFDTSIIIGYLRGSKECKQIIEDVRNGKLAGFLSAVTVFELYLGALLAPNQSEALRDVRDVLSWFQSSLDFNEASAQKTAYLYAKLRQSNELIPLNDLFIAATALTVGLPLSTLNKAHFSRIPGLKLI